MKNILKLSTVLALCVLATTLLRPHVSAQTGAPAWASRERVLQTFDVDTARAVAALEKTISEFCETEERQSAFIAALEANLYPPKTGAARVQVLEEIKERVARELGTDSPVFATISAEKEAAETVLREETARQEALKQESASQDIGVEPPAEETTRVVEPVRAGE